MLESTLYHSSLSPPELRVRAWDGFENANLLSELFNLIYLILC